VAARKYPHVSTRVWIRADISGGPDSCWEWQGRINPKGYGMLFYNGNATGAHRVAYELANGPIPSGLYIDHLCRNTACVNPAHLEAVTNRENGLRGIGPIAMNARKTHCKHGHEFTPENTYRWRTARICRQCRRDRHRKGSL
jgi:HNH endonuclease